MISINNVLLLRDRIKVRNSAKCRKHKKAPFWGPSRAGNPQLPEVERFNAACVELQLLYEITTKG